MILKRQLLDYRLGIVGKEIYMFTANSTLKSDGKLVMGAGNAKVVRDTYVGIDKLFGAEIEDGTYFGVKFVKHGLQWIGAFQTKVHWQDKSTRELVVFSTDKLRVIAYQRPDWAFHLPFPAVNHGGMSVEDVLPIIDTLPDNVFVYLGE